MYYLFMLFLIGGEGSPISAYSYYEQHTFNSMEECIVFYEENEELFKSQAESASRGRFWQLACSDEAFKNNLEEMEIQTKGNMI